MCRVKTWFLIVILFLVIASSGCGGGSGGGSEGNYGYNGNNGGSSGGINGTWEIVSGHGTTTRDGTTEYHYTYAPGRVGEIGVEVSKNNYGYGNPLDNFYALTLTGNEVINSGAKGNSAVLIECTVDERNDGEIGYVMTFGPAAMLEYIGNGTYQMTEKTVENVSGINSNTGNYEYTLTLKDSDTLIWTYWSKTKEASTTLSFEGQWEIVLRRTGTNGRNTTNNNTNNYTDNNTAPNPPNTNNNNSNNTTPNTNTNIPPQISGTWRVTSGSGTATQTVSGNPFIGHLTYTPEIRTEIGLEITQNDYSTYAGDYAGMYSLTLTGDNVINSGTKGGGSFRVPYSVSEVPEKQYTVTFNGGKAFKYAGNGIYRMTKADIMGYNDNSQGYEYSLTLEDANTLRWQYFIPSEGTYELILSKAQ